MPAPLRKLRCGLLLAQPGCSVVECRSCTQAATQHVDALRVAFSRCSTASCVCLAAMTRQLSIAACLFIMSMACVGRARLRCHCDSEHCLIHELTWLFQAPDCRERMQAQWQQAWGQIQKRAASAVQHIRESKLLTQESRAQVLRACTADGPQV